MEMASKFVVQRKSAIWLTTNESSRVCMSKYYNKAYSRKQFLATVSHSIPCVLTQRHCV